VGRDAAEDALPLGAPPEAYDKTEPAVDDKEVTFVVEQDEVAELIKRIEDSEGAVEPHVYHRVQTIVRRPPAHPLTDSRALVRTASTPALPISLAHAARCGPRPR